jgi:hypothetical protein
MIMRFPPRDMKMEWEKTSDEREELELEESKNETKTKKRFHH